jgi:hypothetical protein
VGAARRNQEADGTGKSVKDECKRARADGASNDRAPLNGRSRIACDRRTTRVRGHDPISFFLALSAQAKERKDRHDHHDEPDEINKTVH